MAKVNPSTPEQLLNDPNIEPSESILGEKCGRYYPALRDFLQTISQDPFGLSPEWRFYKDGNAWLCKISKGKKTITWMSVWRGHFKVACYFTEKTGSGIPDLDIDPDLIASYKNAKPIGKLLPMIVEVRKKQELGDAYKIINYKLTQK